MKKIICFNGEDKTEWIKIVSYWQKELDDLTGIKVTIRIDNFNTVEELLPVHIVLLAGLIQRIYDCRCQECFLSCNNVQVRDFLINDLRLPAYWGTNKKAFIDSGTDTIFNLWHATDQEKEFYSRSVPEYLKRKFFKNKDLSAVQTSIMEIYQNVFDHADAQGNSFSYMKYDKMTTRLYVAVCDFGKGIARSIRDFFEDVENDVEALQKAIEPLITTQSRTHNKGWGLSNIVGHIQDGDNLRIVSNNAILILSAGQIKSYLLDVEFMGTLIFYDVSLNNFEDEEIIDNFELDFDF